MTKKSDALVKKTETGLAKKPEFEIKKQTQLFLAVLADIDSSEIKSKEERIAALSKLQKFCSLTPQQALAGTQLRVLQNTIGEKALIKSVFSLLDNIRTGLMIENSEAQEECLILCTVKIINELKDLKLEELAYCFNRARAGHYGKSYHRLNEEVVFSWISEYEKEKIENIHNEHLNKKSMMMGDSSRTSVPSPVDGIIRSLNAVGMMAKEHGIGAEKKEEGDDGEGDDGDGL